MKSKTYYLIGIGGISMSGIALYLKKQGYKVLGSDIQKTQQTESLEQKGIKIYYQHDVKNIKDDIDTVIYTSAIANKDAPGYIELEKAKKLKIPIYKRAVFLGKLFNNANLITISGAHGKTTTTGMIAKILLNTKLDPTVFIGTNVKEFDNTNVYIGNPDLVLLEACEYDRAFLEFTSNIAVITNIEKEHLDYFKGGIQEINQAFADYIKKIKPKGILIAYAQNENIDKAIQYANQKDLKIIRYAQGINSDIVKQIKLQIPGKHNLDNALAAYWVSRELGVSHFQIINSLNQFQGTGRRAELIFENNKIKIFDDYAHHPTEIKATLQGFREKYPNKKIICIYQPHQYSRTKLLFKELTTSFDNCDELILTSVYEVAGREEKKEVGSKELAKEISQIHPNVVYISDFHRVVEYVSKTSMENVIVITMGAGNIYEVALDIKKTLIRK